MVESRKSGVTLIDIKNIDIKSLKAIPYSSVYKRDKLLVKGSQGSVYAGRWILNQIMYASKFIKMNPNQFNQI